MLLGLVLLPEPSVSQRCVEYSKELTALGAMKSCLGAEALAHITLVHAATDADPAVALQEAADVLPERLEISIGALFLKPYPHPYNAPGAVPGGVVAGLAVATSEELRELERRALALPWVQSGSRTTRNGRLFSPHITLGTMDRVPADFSLPADLLDRDPVWVTPAVGPIGPHGVFQKVLGPC